MVRSKEVPKKPKDPLLTPPSNPRGFSTFRDAGGAGGSLPRNRGGAAMSSPAPASVPNYMRGTSSSGAKAGQHHRQRASASASTPTRQRRPLRVTPRGKVLFPAPAAAASPGMVRPTCSSTLKDAKFPRALGLAPGATDAEGPAAMRVCPYTYCSLNGHAHAPAVPLRSFLAARRRLIKTQQSMKHRGVSAFRRGTTAHPRPDDVVCAGAAAKVAPPVVDQDALGDFFVEVYTGPRVSSGTSCSDMSLDEMDATVRRMEFVVFDRCGADDDLDKSNDLAVHGDGDGEDRPGVCRDSSSECSDPGISGNLVEELPWMRYQGYECDSLDDDVSEEQIGEAEALAQQQEGEDEEAKSCGSGDEREDEAIQEQEPEDEEIVSDLPSETGIVAEEEGADCRLDTTNQHEASTAEDTQDPGDDEECVSDGGHEMEIAAEQTCAVSTAEVCREQEEDEDIILGKVCQADTAEEKLSESEIPMSEAMENVLEGRCKEENSADQEAEDDETSMDSANELEISEKQKDAESEMEISETVPDVACEEDFCEQESTSGAVAEVCQGDTSDGQGTSEEKLSESEIPKAEVTERVENVLEDGCKEENSTDQEGKDDETNIDSALRFEIAEKQKDDESEMEISETVPDVAREEDFCEQEATSSAVAEGEISDSSAVGSPDVEIWNQPTDGGFEQDRNTAEDAFEQLDTTAENTVSGTEDAFEQLDTTAENMVSGTEDAQEGLEITTCNSEGASEESGMTQESSQDVNSVCVDAPAKMQPEITENGTEDYSEESSIPQESSQSNMSAHVDNGAQIEVSADATAQMEPEITECKLQESSEESGIPQESSQSSKSALVNNDAETEPEFTTCKSEGPCEESGIVQEVVHDGNSTYLGEGAQMHLGNITRELEATSEECGIAQEIGEDNSALVSDDTQNGSELAMCELDDDSESFAVQETDQDHNCEDVVSAALNESELITPSELANAESGVTQEAVPDDNNADVNDGPERERETMACEPEHAHEELEIIQDDCAAGVCAGPLKETQTSDRKDACEEVCVIEEANLSHAEHNYDLSAADSNGEPQSLPAEDDDAKEFSVDDMCNVFSGMNLKGDVYVDPTESEISPRKRLIIAGRRRTPEEEDHMRDFNPRGPNFLPLELDPDSEKVDLKHQTAEDRKNAEEWMIDYALRRAVNNLGARKKKVELLVQAFETVLPHDEDEKKSTPTRAVQPCN